MFAINFTASSLEENAFAQVRGKHVIHCMPCWLLLDKCVAECVMKVREHNFGHAWQDFMLLRMWHAE